MARNNSVRYPTELRERAVRMVLEGPVRGCIPPNGQLFARWRRCWDQPPKRCASGSGKPRRRSQQPRRITDSESSSWNERTGSCEGREILKAASAFFARELDPQLPLTRTRFGVEPICRVLRERNVGIAPSTYYAYKSRPPSARAQRDGWLTEQIRRVHRENYGRSFQGMGTAQPPRNTSSSRS